DVGLAGVHPAPHVRVDRHEHVADEDPAVGGLGQLGLGDGEVVRPGPAGRPGGEKDLTGLHGRSYRSRAPWPSGPRSGRARGGGVPPVRWPMPATRMRPRHARILHVKVIIKILVVAASLWAATQLVSGITVTAETPLEEVLTLLAVALIFGVVNAVLKPIITPIRGAFDVITLGLFRS